MEKLLSRTVDMSLLISRFQEFLEMDDVRYYVMSSVREIVTRVMDRRKGVGPGPVPGPVPVPVPVPPQMVDAAVLCCCQVVLPVFQTNVFTLMSSISLPSQQSDVCSFMVPQGGRWSSPQPGWPGSGTRPIWVRNQANLGSSLFSRQTCRLESC